MSIKITNNLKVHGESTTQKYTDAQYNTDTQRINGAQPGTPISSKLMNTGLRNATLVTSALIEALKIVVPNNNDLTTAITVGTATTHAALVTALTEALVKIKVETAALADNIKSGTIVQETTTARESKQGYGISLNLNSKLQFKTTWLGTHKNNDVLYYSTAGELKGFYIVKGLNIETTSQSAGTLIITSGQTPTTHATNLQRLTFETAISADTGLSKTDIISSSSTTNQLATAKAIWDYAQPKIYSLSDISAHISESQSGVVIYGNPSDTDTRLLIGDDGTFEFSGNSIITSANIAGFTPVVPTPIGSNITGSVTLNASGYANKFFSVTAASTITIPADTTYNHAVGTEIHIYRSSSSDVTFLPASGVTLTSEGTKRKINAQYQAATLKKIAANSWVLIGALKS